MIAQKTNKISHTVLVRTRHVLPKSEQYAGTKKQVFERLQGWDRQGEPCVTSVLKKDLQDLETAWLCGDLWRRQCTRMAGWQAEWQEERQHRSQR